MFYQTIQVLHYTFDKNECGNMNHIVDYSPWFILVWITWDYLKVQLIQQIVFLKYDFIKITLSLKKNMQLIIKCFFINFIYFFYWNKKKMYCFIKNWKKKISNLFIYFFNILNLIFISINLSFICFFKIIIKKSIFYLNFFKLSIIYVYYCCYYLVSKKYFIYSFLIIIFIIFLSINKIYTSLVRSVSEFFFVYAQCIDPTDQTDMKLMKRAAYGPGPTYDQIRTLHIFNSNEKYLLYWFLAAFRIVLFKWNGYTEQELERFCIEHLDRDVMYAIVDAGKHHFTDFSPEWRPPSDYLKYPIKRHPWMNYGPSLIRQRDYEPLLSILYYGSLLWVGKVYGIPVLKGLFSTWRGNMGMDDDAAQGDNNSNDGYDADEADDDASDDDLDGGLDV